MLPDPNDTKEAKQEAFINIKQKLLSADPSVWLELDADCLRCEKRCPIYTNNIPAYCIKPLLQGAIRVRFVIGTDD